MLGQVTALEGEDGQLATAIVKRNDGSNSTIACDAHAAVLRADHEARPGRRLGPASSTTNLIPVDTEKFETSEPGIFAIGDINTYPGKLKLILSRLPRGAR